MGRTRSQTRRGARSNPRGVLSIRRGGYGFVQTAEGEFFVPAGKMNGAFDGDVVEVSPQRQERSRKALAQAHLDEAAGRKRVARIVRVVERAHAELVGRYEIAEPFGVVVPADPRIPYDIFTRLADSPGIPDGSIVRVAMCTYPSRKEAATGVVVEVLGGEDDERVPIDLIVARYKFETSFSQGALDEAAGAEVDAQGALDAGYVDLRDRLTFTVDPADARDFDDAVSFDAATLPDGSRGWRLGVHIADVSCYVPWGSSVDLDARRRATSVYLVDRVIPMLPEQLSNDVCSLRPGEDRRTMTVDMLVDARGRVVESRAYPALIRSDARLTYDQAQRVIDGGALDAFSVATGVSSSSVEERICGLHRIARMRFALRQAAGGLDFDTAEAKVALDGAGAPIDIVLRERTDATSLIEEAMIAANEAVAAMLNGRGFPCMYRVHDKPARDNLAGLVAVLQEFPWFAQVDQALFVAGNPREVGRVLEACKGRSEAALVTTLVLRSMQRAVYTPDPSPHYALACNAYVHFTSPIRRYPDLIVHRMLKAMLQGRPEKFDQEVSNLAWLAEHSSQMERAADKAAYDSQEVKIIEYLEGHVGENFAGMVAGVATYGLFVRLENTAEGMVEMADLGREYFSLDPVRHTLTGTDTGKVYRLGQHVAVKLVEADHGTRTLRFRMV